jgi:hypothetical protein
MRALSLIGLVFFAVVAAFRCAGAQSSDIAIETTGRGPVATVMVADCPVSLESEAGERGLYLHYRNDCGQPLADKLALLGGLASALAPQPMPERLTLFIGRVVITLPDLAGEAAEASLGASAWDAKRARKDSGYANKTFAGLIEEAPTTRLLAGTLAAWKLRLARVSVEKVLAGKPAETPFASRIESTRIVPFDALTYFIFERQAP